ncbi:MULTISPECIES: hypothetical protein [unclassified Brevibacterium]|uniref:hypothetical protein n=1 Tax=unclassified Brevibacterium TaxID=2614124 RepID=UPI00143DD9C2|nr:hypothetical protein [Brevibacterium sp. S22]
MVEYSGHTPNNIASAMSRWAEFEGVRDHIITNAGHIVTLDSPAAASAEILRVLRRWAA